MNFASDFDCRSFVPTIRISVYPAANAFLDIL